MTKVYIAGPITGLPKEEYLAAFKYWENQARGEYPGAIVINPAEILTPLEGMSQEEFMIICKAMVDVCDMVWLIPGWMSSAGARQERAHALDRGIPVLFIETYVGGMDKGEKQDGIL